MAVIVLGMLKVGAVIRRSMSSQRVYWQYHWVVHLGPEFSHFGLKSLLHVVKEL